MADKNNYIHVRCTERDKQLLNQLAKMDDRTATDWILHQIRQEARKNNIEVNNMEKYYTVNNKGELGCHDASREEAENNLAIMQEKYPDEEWEMFSEDDEE